ncbi:RagB/SusD family nutrient uptake outer membrane protein [Pedobacter nyackensis]|nr:RagB/SusD family nutrient uptake outer membrane protein [Pedobacter nyackensis]
MYRYLIAAIGIITSLSACSKFLDIQPEDQLLEDQVFTSAKNIKFYLNGIYVGLGGKELYGENLTLTVPDVLAHRYNVSVADHAYIRYHSHTYTDGNVANKMAEIWKGAYQSIFNANRLMDNLEKSPGIIDVKTDSTYRGEALAIRAMVHFDILRLFGPMYNSADSTLESVPYCTQGFITINPFLPANEVMSHIMADLSKAESLLFKDRSFSQEKRYKFNYYSVKALQARVNLYRGNKAEALACAKVLIDNGAKFPWVNRDNILSDKVNPDKIFSTEVILGVNNADLAKRQQEIFGAQVPDKNILAPLDIYLTNLYALDDFRFGNDQLWGKSATKAYKTFLKYTDVDDKTKPFRNTVPLLKLSEMYYIAAECEPDPNTAVGYLNLVRYNRNLAAPVAASQLTAELQKEYIREFFGEGQLWYFYKRKNAITIPRGTANATSIPPTTGNETYSMGTAATIRIKYVVPIPDVEKNNR